MINYTHKALRLLSNITKRLSELLLWSYVAVGALKALTDGLHTVGSYIIASCFTLACLYVLLHLASNACKMADNYLLTNEKKHARLRRENSSSKD